MKLHFAALFVAVTVSTAHGANNGLRGSPEKEAKKAAADAFMSTIQESKEDDPKTVALEASRAFLEAYEAAGPELVGDSSSQPGSAEEGKELAKKAGAEAFMANIQESKEDDPKTAALEASKAFLEAYHETAEADHPELGVLSYSVSGQTEERKKKLKKAAANDYVTTLPVSKKYNPKAALKVNHPKTASKNAAANNYANLQVSKEYDLKTALKVPVSKEYDLKTALKVPVSKKYNPKAALKVNHPKTASKNAAANNYANLQVSKEYDPTTASKVYHKVADAHDGISSGNSGAEEESKLAQAMKDLEEAEEIVQNIKKEQEAKGEHVKEPFDADKEPFDNDGEN